MTSKVLSKRRAAHWDASGHLKPGHAAVLLAHAGEAFLDPDPRGFLGRVSMGDELAERFGEQFLEIATSGENTEQELFDQMVPEEMGGPFVQTSAWTEFADGTDASNLQEAPAEPFPKT